MASDPPIPIPIFNNNNEDEDLLDDDDDPANDTDNDSSSSAAALHVTTPTPAPAPITAIKKPTAQLDESRKLFQRLWTDEDEIELLQGYLDYTTQRGTSGSHSSQHHHDTSAFYDQIRSKFQLDFNKNQLVEKLRRLKKKYRNVVNKFGSGKEYVFKSPHDQTTFGISSRIWGNIVANGSGLRITAGVPIPMFEDEDGDPESPNPNDIDMNSKFPKPRKRSRVGTVKVEDKQQAEGVTPVGVALAGSISGVIEETVKSCLSPIIKELLGNSVNLNGGMNGAVLSPMPLGFGSIGAEKMGDGRWRKQQILELEVFSKRLELMQDEVNAKLQELRSTGD